MILPIKKYYENPKMFIFYKSDFNDKENCPDFIGYFEALQSRLEELQIETKILINHPDPVRHNTLNNLFRVKEDMETDFWWRYSPRTSFNVFVKDLKTDPLTLAETLAEALVNEQSESEQEQCTKLPSCEVHIEQ